MPAPNASPGDTFSAEAALEALAAELDRRDFATTLTPGEGRRPRLTVMNRHAQLTEDIYVDHRSYWWPWAQPIAAVGNPKAAATKISHVLRAAPGEPSHG
jgi:hypothetical protein